MDAVCSCFEDNRVINLAKCRGRYGKIASAVIPGAKGLQRCPVAPRIRDLADKRLYVPGKVQRFPSLAGLIGGTINSKLIAAQWQEVLRLTTSIRQGTVTASLILRKLGSYPRQNSLAAALREIGRIERILLTLAWLQSPDLRHRFQVGLNKGEATTY